MLKYIRPICNKLWDDWISTQFI